MVSTLSLSPALGPDACPRAWPGPGRWVSRVPRPPGRRAAAAGRQRRAPRIGGAQQSRGGADGEVGRRHPVEVVPGHREGHRHAGTDARTVGRHDGGAAGSGRIQEHLAVPVLLDERRRRQLRVEAFGPGGESPGWRRRRPRATTGGQRDEDVQTLGAAGLHRSLQTRLGQRGPHQCAAGRPPEKPAPSGGSRSITR